MRSRLAVALILAWPSMATADVGPARVVELEHLLKHDCGSCHGMTRKGGLGSPLRPDDLAGKDPQALADVILDGVPGTPMPPWRPLLTAQDAQWLVARLMKGDMR